MAENNKKQKADSAELAEPKKGMTWCVCVDGSAKADVAFQWTTNTMHKEKDTLVVLNVSEKVSSTMKNYSKFFSKIEAELNEEVKHHQQEIISRYEQKCKELNLNFSVKGVIGDNARDEICQFVEHQDIDNLVLGKRGMSDSERLLLGSTTEYCVRHAHANVIVVK